MSIVEKVKEFEKGKMCPICESPLGYRLKSESYSCNGQHWEEFEAVLNCSNLKCHYQEKCKELVE